MDKLVRSCKDAIRFMALDQSLKALDQIHICSGFDKYSRVYRMTNENLNALNKIIDVKGKDVLTVCGSGDQYLNFILRGAENVDVFDINVLTEYYLILKITAVLVLPLTEFRKFFIGCETLRPCTERSFFDSNIYSKISPYLPPHVRMFWDIIYSENEKSLTDYSSSFINFIQSGFNFSYLLPGAYKKLQILLERKELPKFYECDLLDIAKVTNGPYDIAYFSNIFDYIYSDDIKLREAKVFLEGIRNLLKTDGCFVNYEFDALKNEKYLETSFEISTFTFEGQNSSIYFNDGAFVYRKK